MGLEDQLKTDCGRAVASSKEWRETLEEIRKEGGLAKGPAGPKSQGAIAANAMFEVYVNGLLSFPATHGVNFVSNVVPMATRLLETAAAAGWSTALRTQADRTSFLEVLGEAHGMAAGLVDAIRFVDLRLKSISKGLTNEELLKQQHLPERLAIQSKIEWEHKTITGKNVDNVIMRNALNYFGNFINIPGGALSTTDTFFKIFHYRGTVGREAMHAAVNQTDLPTGQAYKKILQETLAGNNPKIKAKAIEDADVRTFTNEPYSWLNKWMAGKGHDIAGLRWIVPFRRAVVNINEYAARSTFIPMAYAGGARIFGKKTKTWQELASKEPSVRNAALGRMTAGTALIYGLYSQFAPNIVGRAPKDPQLRDRFDADGKKEYSIELENGMKIEMRYLGPVGALLRTLATFQDYASNVDPEIDGQDKLDMLYDFGEMLTLAVADLMMEEHWLGNVTDLFGSLSNAVQEESINPLLIYGAKFAAGMQPYSGIIRRGVIQGAPALGWEGTDPIKREIHGPLDYIQQAIIGMSNQLQPKIDLWGDPMRHEAFLDPVFASDVTGMDPVAVEMRRLKIRLAKVSHKKDGVTMTPEEYTWLQIASGKGVNGRPPLREEIVNRMNSKMYHNRKHDEGKAAIIKDAILKYRGAAMEALKHNPEFEFGQKWRDEQMRQSKKIHETI